MKISILGAGNSGCAIAADLTLKGHDVTLIKTSKSMHNDNFEFMINNNNELTIWENDETKKARISKVTDDLSKIKGSEIVMIFIQTNYHEQLIKKAAQFFENGQTVIINPGYLSTSYMIKYCGNKDLTVVEATSSFIDCRIIEPGYIRAGFRNVRNPIAVYPCKYLEKTKKQLEVLGYNFHYFSIPEVALHNPNLIVHTVGAVMSIPRIEKTNGDYCMYWEVWTPSVWNILEKLDSEKMDILEHLGYERLAYVDACKFRNTLEDERDGKEIFMWYANMPTRAKGPVKVDSRYISEDVPQGLVLLETLGEKLNVATPVCTALIEIASAALGRDLRAEGRTIHRLGEENISRILEDINSNGK